MTRDFSYQDYVSDEKFLTDYNKFQKKYAVEPRESDKKIIDLVRRFLSQRVDQPDPAQLLDIGCSTGNLLGHLKRSFGERLAYTGGDLALSSLEACRANPDLAGIAFAALDIHDLPKDAFDVIVVNAVLYMFDAGQHRRALKSIRQSLKPRGIAIIFDFAHEFAQDVEILEKTKSHPQGLRICLRTRNDISQACAEAGLADITFLPFEMPIDLPRPDDVSEIDTYTEKTADGRRLSFRGILFQPWCHMVATRSR